MKLSLQEIANKIDLEIGKLSPIIPTKRVIINKFALTRMHKVTRHIKTQKRRSYESWVKLLLLTGTLVPARKSEPEPVITETLPMNEDAFIRANP